MRIFFALCALLFSLNAFSATVMVSMVQNADAPPFALEMTRIVENQIMDDYFASGEIVSNMQIVANGPLSDRESEARVREAAEGKADYLLSVYIEYAPAERQAAPSGAASAVIGSAEWQLIDVRSSEIAGSGFIEMERSEDPRGNPHDRARAAAAAISRESLRAQHEEARRQR